MKKTMLWIAAVLLAVSLCGCSQLPEVSVPEESEVIPSSQAEESPAPENSSEITDKSSISFSDSSDSSPAEQEEISEEVAETTTSESSTSTPAPKQTTPAVSESAKEPEQPASTAQQPTESPKPQETPPPIPAPTEPIQTFDVSQYVSYAKSYGQGIGLSLDSTATACWDNPLIASSSSTTLERDIKNMLDWYRADGNNYFWVWTESRSDGKFNLYIGYA